jgi:hypothetical protein
VESVAGSFSTTVGESDELDAGELLEMQTMAHLEIEKELHTALRV